MFHHLPLVGTWGRASFPQAPKTFSSSLPSCLPFLSRSGWINFPWKSKKHVLASSQRFTFSLLLGAPPSTALASLLPQLQPSGLRLPGHSCWSSSISMTKPLCSSQNKIHTLFCLLPLCPVFLTHWEPCEGELCSPYYSRMLPPQHLHTGRLPAVSSPASPTTDRGHIDIHASWALLWIMITCRFPGTPGS